MACRFSGHLKKFKKWHISSSIIPLQLIVTLPRTHQPLPPTPSELLQIKKKKRDISSSSNTLLVDENAVEGKGDRNTAQLAQLLVAEDHDDVNDDDDDSTASESSDDSSGTVSSESDSNSSDDDGSDDGPDSAEESTEKHDSTASSSSQQAKDIRQELIRISMLGRDTGGEGVCKATANKRKSYLPIFNKRIPEGLSLPTSRSSATDCIRSQEILTDIILDRNIPSTDTTHRKLNRNRHNAFPRNNILQCSQFNPIFSQDSGLHIF